MGDVGLEVSTEVILRILNVRTRLLCVFRKVLDVAEVSRVNRIHVFQTLQTIVNLLKVFLSLIHQRRINLRGRGRLRKVDRAVQDLWEGRRLRDVGGGVGVIDDKVLVIDWRHGFGYWIEPLFSNGVTLFWSYIRFTSVRVELFPISWPGHRNNCQWLLLLGLDGTRPNVDHVCEGILLDPEVAKR